MKVVLVLYSSTSSVRYWKRYNRSRVLRTRLDGAVERSHHNLARPWQDQGRGRIPSYAVVAGLDPGLNPHIHRPEQSGLTAVT